MCQISGCSLSCQDGLHTGSYAHGPETRCRPPACNPHSPRRWEVAFVIQLLSTQEPPDRRADMRDCPDNLTASRRGTRGRSRARRRFKRRNVLIHAVLLSTCQAHPCTISSQSWGSTAPPASQVRPYAICESSHPLSDMAGLSTWSQEKDWHRSALEKASLCLACCKCHKANI